LETYLFVPWANCSSLDTGSCFYQEPTQITSHQKLSDTGSALISHRSGRLPIYFKPHFIEKTLVWAVDNFHIVTNHIFTHNVAAAVLLEFTAVSGPLIQILSVSECGA